MKLKDAMQYFSFDDVLLKPGHSQILSRGDPDISINSKYLTRKIPIIASPMNSIAENEMITAMCSIGATGVLHRYMSLDDQLAEIRKIHKFKKKELNFFVAVSSTGDFLDRVKCLDGIGVTRFCVDVANGHNIHCINAVKAIRKALPKSIIMAGNVCTWEGTRDLAEAGANLIRVGVGPGAMCTTRIVTGHGVPQLSAIEDCAQIKNTYDNVVVIADGGLRNSGDCVKALAIGADALMIGSMLAGSIETPGEIIEEDGRLYKYFAGMASLKAREKFFDKSKAGLPVEGISTKVPFLGKSAKHIVEGLAQSIKVGLSYTGASNLEELRKKAQWCRITPAGMAESLPHGKRS